MRAASGIQWRWQGGRLQNSKTERKRSSGDSSSHAQYNKKREQQGVFLRHCFTTWPYHWQQKHRGGGSVQSRTLQRQNPIRRSPVRLHYPENRLKLHLCVLGDSPHLFRSGDKVELHLDLGGTPSTRRPNRLPLIEAVFAR